MSQVSINFYDEEINTKDEILIKAAVDDESSFEYKFFEGKDGVWNPIQDFSSVDYCIWKPKVNGKYIIMVQAKENESKKPFDYLGKEEFDFVSSINSKGIEENWEEDKHLIRNINIDKEIYSLGEKVNLQIETFKPDVLLRIWKKGQLGWEPIRDYGLTKHIRYTSNSIGEQELLIEAKLKESHNKVDDFRTIKFTIVEREKIEVMNFKCLSETLLVNDELIFKIETSHDNNRNLLYKYLRIDKSGKVKCIQDYSSKQIVSFKEKEEGKYKLLCLVRDIFSNNEYDDRAILSYEVSPYSKVDIKLITTSLISPQVVGSNVELKAIVEGGKELVYRYIINGPEVVDTEYMKNSVYHWSPQKPGEYTILLYAKDISNPFEYEDCKQISFTIDNKGLKPIKILDIICSETKNCIIGQPVNFKIMAEGGGELKYSFIVYKDNRELEKIEYGDVNWADFTPLEKGNYEIELRVKDKYSPNSYDNHSYIYLKVKEYMPVEIDYLLMSSKDCYLVGDTIDIDVITQNTGNTLLRYVTLINEREVEDTGYIKNTKLKVKPKCSGKYRIVVYGKNVKCADDYDCKREIAVYVHEAVPVTTTKITSNKETFKVNEEITFEVNSEGGKEVCYEFYIMEKGNWIKSQKYSRKNYYTFIPFTAGRYRLLVLSKSFYKKVNYEDYDIFEFIVEY